MVDFFKRSIGAILPTLFRPYGKEPPTSLELYLEQAEQWYKRVLINVGAFTKTSDIEIASAIAIKILVEYWKAFQSSKIKILPTPGILMFRITLAFSIRYLEKIEDHERIMFLKQAFLFDDIMVAEYGPEADTDFL